MNNNLQRALIFVKLRQRVELTQEELARAVGVAHRTIQNWESGKVLPRLTPPQFRRLAQVLDCSLEELVDAFDFAEEEDSSSP